MEVNDIVYHKFLGKLTVSSIDGEMVKFFETSELVFPYDSIEPLLCSESEYFAHSNLYDVEMLEKSISLRQIKFLVHVTTFNNLLNIIKKGIIPRSHFKKITYNSTSFISDFKSRTNKVVDDSVCEVSDLERWDKRTDHSCFSITGCNEDLIKKYMCNNEYRYCKLKLKSEILSSAFLNEHFFYYNAACGYFRYSARKSLNNFNEMFKKEFEIPLSYRPRPLKFNRQVSANRPTSTQAEILIGKIISPSFIEEIVFQCEADKKEFIETVDVAYIKNIKITVGELICG